jgi:hypothetical protein
LQPDPSALFSKGSFTASTEPGHITSFGKCRTAYRTARSTAAAQANTSIPRERGFVTRPLRESVKSHSSDPPSDIVIIRTPSWDLTSLHNNITSARCLCEMGKFIVWSNSYHSGNSIYLARFETYTGRIWILPTLP